VGCAAARPALQMQRDHATQSCQLRTDFARQQQHAATSTGGVGGPCGPSRGFGRAASGARVFRQDRQESADEFGSAAAQASTADRPYHHARSNVAAAVVAGLVVVGYKPGTLVTE
jgi:hypothetical protein